ncbi:MAG: hypothetical protein Q9M91_02525 [Candidatus Dojkabacteria bacterium]|nr:hypothetical protein [Candidatus Dojkabacteria bacterium]MDQ7020700.1 hypothetical protein [Candidatus Dojkabacteria bacterium]
MTEEKSTFKSYIVKLGIIFIILGVLYGIFAVFLALIGGDVTFEINTTTYTGGKAAILSILICPILGAVVGRVIAAVTYLPYKFITKNKSN